MISDSDLAAAGFALLSEVATYTPPGGQAITIRVIPGWDAATFGQLTEVQRIDAPTFRVLISTISSPAIGATITHAGNSYTVESYERTTQSEWTLYVRP